MLTVTERLTIIFVLVLCPYCHWAQILNFRISIYTLYTPVHSGNILISNSIIWKTKSSDVLKSYLFGQLYVKIIWWKKITMYQDPHFESKICLVCLGLFKKNLFCWYIQYYITCIISSVPFQGWEHYSSRYVMR